MSNRQRLAQFVQQSKHSWSRLRLNLQHPYFDRFTLKEYRARWSAARILKSKDFFRNFFFVGWTRPVGDEAVSPKSEFHWPLYINARYNQAV